LVVVKWVYISGATSSSTYQLTYPVHKYNYDNHDNDDNDEINDDNDGGVLMMMMMILVEGYM